MKTTTLSMRIPTSEAVKLAGLAKRVGLDRATLLKQALRRGCEEVLFERACQAYRHGEITLSKAAEMAGIGLREMLLRASRESIELNYTVQDLARDLGS